MSVLTPFFNRKSRGRTTKMMSQKLDESKSRVAVNFKRIRLEKAYSVQELCNLAGCHQSYISQIENGLVGFGKRALLKWSALFQVDPMEFYRPLSSTTGINEKKQEETVVSFHNRTESFQQIPVISFVQAGQLTEVIDLYEPGHAERYVSFHLNDPNAFGLTVSGKSMEPEFHPGEVVIVSPNRECRVGDYVVARKEGEATLKLLKRFTPQKTVVLKPLNPAFDEIAYNGEELKGVELIGRVVGKVSYY